MKVAFLSYDFGEYSVRLASALAREAEVLLLLPNQQAAPYLSILDESVRFQPFDRPRYRQPLRQLQTTYSLLRRIREFGPDLIHLQQGHMWFNLALPLLKRYPLVLTIHDPRHHVGDMASRKAPQWILDLGFRQATQVIVQGAQLVAVVVDRLGIPAERVHVIPHIGLGDAQAHDQEAEEEHLVLFFGRIWEYKGLEYLIRAEPLITSQVPEARIAIAGQGEDFARYRRMMVNPDRFEIHNEFVSDEKRTELFRRAGVVVLPYIDASQSGVVPLAYTFSKPVVATTVGGLPDVVEQGNTGFLVPPRDEGALAEAVVRLLRDRDLRHQMGRNGKQKIDSECSPEIVGRKTVAVYRLALEHRQSGRPGRGEAQDSRIGKGTCS